MTPTPSLKHRHPATSWWRPALIVIVVLGLLRWAVLRLALQDTDIGLQVDESQYWNWSQALQWGYYSKPPGIAALIAATTALWGDTVIAIKAVGLLTYPVTALVLAWLAQAMTPAGTNRRRAAGLAALIFLSSPLAALLGLAATTDAPLLLAWSLATALLWQLIHRPSHQGSAGLWLLLGAVIGLGLLSKYTFAAWLPGALWIWWRHHQNSSQATRPPLLTGPVLALGVCAALLLPHLLWSASQGWPTLQHTADITVASGAKSSLGPRMTEALAGPAVMLGLLWLLWLPALWRHRQTRSLTAAGQALWAGHTPGAFLVVLNAPLALAGLAQALSSGTQLNWTAPLVLPLTLLLALALTRTRFTTWTLVATLSAHLALSTVLPLANPLWQQAQAAGWVAKPLPRALDLWGRMRGWGAAYAQMHEAARAHLQAHPQSPVVGASRTVVAHGTFLWRDLHAHWMTPRPDGPPHDHYQLTAGWPNAQAPATDAPLLIVQEGEAATLPPEVLAHVKAPELLVQARAPQGSQRVILMQLWRAWPATDKTP